MLQRYKVEGETVKLSLDVADKNGAKCTKAQTETSAESGKFIALVLKGKYRTKNLLSNGVKHGGILSLHLLSVYMDDLSVSVNKLQIVQAPVRII